MSPRRKSTLLPAVLCLAAAFLLLRDPQLAARGFQSGISLCISTVLPALFPFFVLCEMLLSCPIQGRFLRWLASRLGFRQESGLVAVLLSWFGGYAICARLAGRLRQENRLDQRDAALLMLLGCCSSPGFVIGCVGGLLLGNLRLGVLLYGLQLAANLLSTALCLPLLPSVQKANSTPVNEPPACGISRAISAAVTTSLNVCGCVVFFRTVGAVLEPLLLQNIWSRPLLNASLEISSGCADFAALGGRASLYGCCLCMSLLGISVWAQLSLLAEKAVPLRLLAMNRAVHLVVFLGMVRLLTRFLPGTLSAYSTLAQRVIPTRRLPLDAAVIVFLFVCAALYKVRQNFYNR